MPASDELWTPAFHAWQVSSLRDEVVICDESSLAERHFGVGGVWLAPSDARTLRIAIGEMCEAHGWRRNTEFKWTKLGGKGPPPVPYVDLVETFFASKVRFNAMIVDRHNAGLRSELTPEQIYYRRFHWLLRKRMRRECSYRVAIDRKHDRQGEDLEATRLALNGVGRGEHGLARDAFREIVSRDSKADPLIQIADVLLGAVCYHFNGKHREIGASASKCELAKLVALRSQANHEIAPTWPSESKFNIWLWSPTADTKHGGRPSG